jgi:hypothetical protein
MALRPQVIWDTALEAAGINMPILAPLQAGFRSRGGGMNRLAADPSKSDTRPVCELRLCERHVKCRTFNVCASLWGRRRTRAKGLDRRDNQRRGKERCVFGCVAKTIPPAKPNQPPVRVNKNETHDVKV